MVMKALVLNNLSGWPTCSDEHECECIAWSWTPHVLRALWMLPFSSSTLDTIRTAWNHHHHHDDDEEAAAHV